jgi:hypothetical protein
LANDGKEEFDHPQIQREYHRPYELSDLCHREQPSYRDRYLGRDQGAFSSRWNQEQGSGFQDASFQFSLSFYHLLVEINVSRLKFVANKVLNLVDHAADTVVVFVSLSFPNTTETQTFHHTLVGFGLADQAALLRHNNLAHVLTPIFFISLSLRVSISITWLLLSFLLLFSS